jgi:hypothetical protein
MPESKPLKIWPKWKIGFGPWKIANGHMTLPLNHLPGHLPALGHYQYPTSRSAILLHLRVLTQTTLTIVHMPTGINDSGTAGESKSHLAILSRLALALESGETGEET